MLGVDLRASALRLERKQGRADLAGAPFSNF